MSGRTRAVPKEKCRTYVKRSNDFQLTAEAVVGREVWDVAVSTAVHAGIGLANALAVYCLGLRSVARDQDESIRLLCSMSIDWKEIERNAKLLSDLLDVKSLAEYEESQLKATDAEVAIKKSKRFRDWPMGKLPKWLLSGHTWSYFAVLARSPVTDR